MPTIGVSIPIPEPYGTYLQGARIGLGDEAGRLIPAHITLVPPVEVAAETLVGVSAHLAEVAAEHAAFEIRLRGTGTFRPVSPVVFVALSAGISSCEQLAAGLRSGPLDITTTFPYHPHVTIAQDIDDAALDQGFDDLADFECRFVVTEFHLYRHDETAGWVPVSTFALDG